VFHRRGRGVVASRRAEGATAVIGVKPVPTQEPDPTRQPGAASWTRSLASGSGQLFGATLAQNVGLFAAVLVITRALVPAERGTVAFVIVTALVAAYLCGLGLGEAATVFASTRPESRPRLLTNLLLASALASVAAAVAVALLLDALAGVRPRGITTLEVFLLGVGVVVTTLYEAAKAFLLGSSQFRSLALVQAVWPWVYAGLLLVVSLTSGLTVVASITCWVACFGAAALTLIVIAVRHAGLGRPDAQLFRSSMHFGLRAWPISASRFMNFRADQILMGFLATQAALGIYAVAVSASEALLYLSFAVGSAIVPVIGGSEESKRGERTLQTLRALLLTTAVAAALAAVVGPTLLPLVFGADYQRSVTPFLFLLPGALGFAVLAVLGGALVAGGRPGRASSGFVVATVVGIGLDFALIPPLHATGAAIAASAAFIVGGGAAIATFRGTHPVPWHAFVPGKDDVRSLVALVSSGALRRRRRGDSD
jgi:O-antigen/teichoic acid export membrane protein